MPDPFSARDLIWAASLLITVGISWGHAMTRIKHLEDSQDHQISRETVLAMFAAIETRLKRIEALLDRRTGT